MVASAEFFYKPDGLGIKEIINDSNLFFKAHGLSHITSREQIMIIDELVKFGSKFGDIELSKYEIKVQISIDKETIVVEVSKPIDCVDIEHLERLEETIQFIRGFQDPFEAFIKIKSDPYLQQCKCENGLGLAKIAYQGNAIVDFFINEDNILNLSAVRNLNK